MVGAAGSFHTAVLTEAGELFTFGEGDYGQLCRRRQLGHGGEEAYEDVQRRVEALAGKNVFGASTFG